MKRRRLSLSLLLVLLHPHAADDAMWRRLQASSVKVKTALREARLRALATEKPDGVRWCQVGG